MSKRLLFILFFVFLIISAGTWGILSIHAHLLSVNTPSSLFATATRLIPTVKVSTSTAYCNPKHVPGIAEDPAQGIGGTAIKPHLCSIPTFTEQDVRQYMRTFSRFTSLRIEQTSPHFTVTRILFVTNQVANEILNADTGVSYNNLVVCYVEVYGDFLVASPFASSPPRTQHHGQMIFDGVTGNMFTIGVFP